MICVEPGIGYAGGHWARWKIFESYAIYHAYCGLKNVGQCNQDWYEVVIPNYFDVDDFDYCDQKEDYFLYLGRVYSGKGVDVAIQATQAAGKKLVIAGQKEDGYKLRIERGRCPGEIVPKSDLLHSKSDLHRILSRVDYRNWAPDDEKKLKREHFVHYPYIPGFGFYAFIS